METGTVLDKPVSAPPGQRKFAHPDITAKGETRASVHFTGLKTLWLNTGTLCNIECANCYIESSPRNDRLAYLTRADAAQASTRPSKSPTRPSRSASPAASPS